MTEQKRGQLTQRIKDKSKELLGREITVRELRLMVFIQYVLTNEQTIDHRRINDEEREIWKTCLLNGHAIKASGNKIRVTKEFWDIICELVWLGYVDLHDGQGQ